MPAEATQIRNRRYEILSTTLTLLALVLLADEFSRTRPLAGRIVLGALCAIAAILVMRAPRSATAVVTDNALVIRNLIRTSKIPLSEVAQFTSEVGYVNLYRRVYPRVVLNDGVSRRLTQFNRPMKDASVMESQVLSLNRTLEARRRRGIST